MAVFTDSDFVDIHVQILGEDCVELRNFCDTLTPHDTHIYNFGDLVSNVGQDIEEGILQGKEGIVVITPVEDCPNGSAVAYHNLQGSLRVIDSSNIVDYGTNVYTRRPIQGECTESVTLFL
ncbi:MAG: hypothetical protein KatS3mg078_1522 [Deltaproteobacteria bacterium]|nr:MAG: hypothetical protein KatS3mg078_1522 [Deltaproteobacteria bacterium]